VPPLLTAHLEDSFQRACPTDDVSSTIRPDCSTGMPCYMATSGTKFCTSGVGATVPDTTGLGDYDYTYY
jgi:hypothetical protein